MILDSTLKSIEVRLGEVITTNNLDVTAAWGDYTGPGFLPVGSDTVTNGTAVVTVVAAPSVGVERLCTEITVHNNDTVPHVVILQVNDNGTKRIFRYATVPANGDFIYAPTVAPSAGSSGSVPGPTSGTALDFVRINAAGTAYEVQTPAQVLADIGGAPLLAATDNIGRNKLHNPLFNIAQRGAGPFTTAVYTLDRWQITVNLDTLSVTQNALADADRTAIGDEEATYALQNVFAGNAGAAAFDVITQKIEFVRRLSGKTVTVSFWAKAATGTPSIGVSIDQVFGTGGSPSANVQGAGTAVPISTTWTRYSLQLAVASEAGKTFGTTVGTDYSALNLWYSSGATNATRAGSIGVQSGTIQVWGVQLEIAAAASALEKPDPRYDLSNCQRFYAIGTCRLASYGAAGAAAGFTQTFPTTMRATPTPTSTFGTQTNCSTSTFTAFDAETGGPATVVTALGGFLALGTYTVSADL